MTQQSATPPIWFPPILRWGLPWFLIVAGSHFAEGDNLWAAFMAVVGLSGLFRFTKAVNQTPWVTVGVRISVAAAFFYTGGYIEMGDLPFAIGFGVGGFLVYGWLFRPDWSTSVLASRMGWIASAETATDDSTTEESETPD